MADDKYKMFKNFMHNELGITKDDIRQWVKESVEHEVRVLVGNELDKERLEEKITKVIMNHVNYSFYTDIKKHVAEELIDKRGIDIVLRK